MRLVFFISLLLVLASANVSEPLFFSANSLVGQNAPEIKKDPFDSLDIEAKSALVLDLSDEKPIFQKNSDAELPLASLTKLVTAAVVYDIGGSLLKDGAIIIPVTAEAVLQE